MSEKNQKMTTKMSSFEDDPNFNAKKGYIEPKSLSELIDVAKASGNGPVYQYDGKNPITFAEQVRQMTAKSNVYVIIGRVMLSEDYDYQVDIVNKTVTINTIGILDYIENDMKIHINIMSDSNIHQPPIIIGDFSNRSDWSNIELILGQTCDFLENTYGILEKNGVDSDFHKIETAKYILLQRVVLDFYTNKNVIQEETSRMLVLQKKRIDRQSEQLRTDAHSELAIKTNLCKVQDNHIMYLEAVIRQNGIKGVKLLNRPEDKEEAKASDDADKHLPF